MAAQPTTNITFQNFYSATLTADITAISTDIFLDVVPNGTEGFLVIDPDSTTGREIIYYNSKTATKVTCPSAVDGRGQDDTTAGPHLTGTTVIMAPVAAYYETLLALFTTSPQGWTTVSGAISAVTANGNRSYTLTTASDQSAVISPGMRLRTTRTVAAPTQCTNLNGTTQFYNRSTTINGMTFTNNFTASAWVKLTAYPTTASGHIISRFNGTSGWYFGIATTGQVIFYGLNGAASNNSGVQSYQSIPLNKWVHVAAQLDMASFTATTTTSYIMIDGVDVPSQVQRAGTNPTAIVQAGNLEVGSSNAGSFFPGKIAQAAIYGAKVTQATILASMHQGLAGTETSLISAYSFSNSINDLNTTNANNLTANGSVVATYADSPFGGSGLGTISSTLDYGIVQKVTSSTITVHVAEGCTIPTSGGVTSASYSTYKAPFGFPASRTKWRIEVHLNLTTAVTIGNAWQAIPIGLNIVVPVGEWDFGMRGYFEKDDTTASATFAMIGLSSTGSAPNDPNLITTLTGSAGQSYFGTQVDVRTGITNTSPVTYVLWQFIQTGTSTTFGYGYAGRSNFKLYAESAYI